ncbi:hypothetical protein IWQ60_004066 [Tieghemiomyces parasiticus]|uniref:Inner membrane component domain-containing protein n=1 Tax=Tieghemiomyces parasiticus TaxID=78921 RepID=A0A9W8AC42_9FUNG|nr:hypothetical protein IWQ60_004066 [Tieghemiomyces parasiticus]
MCLCLNLLGNVLWMVLGGWVVFLYYVLGGAILCLTIIGIPFGYQCFKMALVGLWPFGKTVHWNPELSTCLTTVFNLVWLVLFGWELFLLHLILMLVFAITIIGIPFAVQQWKLAKVSLWPFGTSIVEDGESVRAFCPV